MRRIVLLSVDCPAVPYFLHYLINGTIFGKKKLLNVKSVFWFSLQLFLSETFLAVRRTERDVIKNVHWSSCKVSVILVSEFNEIGISWTEESSNIKFHESPSSGSRVVPYGRTDRQAWRSLIVAFRNSANAPKFFFLNRAKNIKRSTLMSQWHVT